MYPNYELPTTDQNVYLYGELIGKRKALSYTVDIDVLSIPKMFDIDMVVKMYRDRFGDLMEFNFIYKD